VIRQSLVKRLLTIRDIKHFIKALVSIKFLSHERLMVKEVIFYAKK